MSTKYVLFRREARHGKVVKSLKPLLNKVNVTMQRLPLFGKGLLSGSFPLSLVTQGGNLPSQANIRILYRPEQGANGDGYVVATTTCNADGSWQVSGLNENLKFDIVARIPGFNDVIISNVQPMGAPLSAHFANLKEEYEYQEEVNIQVVALGGRPPYTYEAITLPDELSLSSNGYITGTILDTLELTFEVKVTDAEGSVINLVGNSYVNGDPHWDNVAALLHFDGDLEDAKGGAWVASGSLMTWESAPPGFGSAIRFRGENEFITGPKLIFGSSDYTVELRFRLTDGPLPAGRNRYILTTSGPDYLQGMVISVRSNTGDGNTYLYAQNGVGGGEIMITSNTPINDDQYHHVALVRESGQLRLYLDGVEVGSATGMMAEANSRAVRLGSDYNNSSRGYNGEIDELRITIGVARYTENFTPPTEPFSNY